MKKTIVTLLALAGVAAANGTVTPVATVTHYEVTSSGAISLATTTTTTNVWSAFSGKLDAETGFTLQITLSDWTCDNGPLFYFSTADVNNSNNATSIVTIGYTKGINNTDETKWTGATIFNSTNGSSADNRVNYQFTSTDPVIQTLPSHGSLNNGKLEDTVSLFVTGKGGAITLYEVDNSNNLVKIATTTNVATGTAKSIVFSQWTSTAKNNNRATIDMVAYSGVLTTEQMTSLIAPEPTTATLSLLALAGLAARRRRK